jgi:chaperonin GroEL
MNTKFSLGKELFLDSSTIEIIDECVKITLGPTGKNGILLTPTQNLKIITNGSLLIKSLRFSSPSANILLQLLEQASVKTYLLSGDGSTVTILLACQLLKNSSRLITSGYNSVFLSNGLKKVAHFLLEKVVEFALPVSKTEEMVGILRTSLGKKVTPEIFDLVKQGITQIGRDGLLLVEETVFPENSVDVIQGIELDKGFASSYFVNELKSFEVIYENPYVLITKGELSNLNQLQEIIEFIKINNRPLVIVGEDISKNVISTLVLNNIQNKIKVVVVKYSAIKFMATGILEDLALLTHANSFDVSRTESNIIYKVEDLGQAKKVIIKKEKSTFFISKFAKLVAIRRINELNRDLLTTDSEYEKNIYKTRIARLSGQIAKIKLGPSNQYEVDEIKQKIENSLMTVKSSLEEGFLPGGGSFYLHVAEEVIQWSSLNLIGEELLASYMVANALQKPFETLLQNQNISTPSLSENIKELGYPYGYNVLTKKVVNTISSQLIDSAKAIRASLWNAISIVSTIIVSE